MRQHRYLPAALATLMFLSGAAPLFAQSSRTGPWNLYYNAAIADAKKQDKVLMIYFSGSDWCPYCKDLEKTVLSTDAFLEFAKEKLVLLQVDFPAQGKQSSMLKQQAEEMKQRYNITLTPTFVFVDSSGRILERAHYDDALLRKEEAKGQPRAWIDFVENVVKQRPMELPVEIHEGLSEGRAAAIRHGLPLLLIITNTKSKLQTDKADAVVNDPSFIRFANATMVMTHIEPPEEGDDSLNARAFRAFKVQNRIPDAVPQIVLFDMAEEKVVFRIVGIQDVRTSSVIAQIEKALPPIPYNGEWIEDYHKARAIAAQTRRTLLISFEGSDWSEFSIKQRKEVYDSDYFKEYAKEHLVLVQIDFPKMKEQTEERKKSNKTLADIYNVRGYPTMVILNAGGQLIAKADYQKGGAMDFIDRLKDVRKADLARRDHPSQW